MTEGLAERSWTYPRLKNMRRMAHIQWGSLTLLTLLQLLIRSFNNANTVDTEVRSMNG